MVYLNLFEAAVGLKVVGIAWNMLRHGVDLTDTHYKYIATLIAIHGVNQYFNNSEERLYIDALKSAFKPRSANI